MLKSTLYQGIYSLKKLESMEIKFNPFLQCADYVMFRLYL